MSRIPGRLRAVFDCNILIQAIAFDNSPAAKCVQVIESGEVELFLSRPTLAELRRVLEYQEVLALSPNITAERIGAFLHRLSFRATLVRRVRHIMDYSRDPKDEPYIDLAVSAKADYLVSRDKDLLALMTGHSAECKRFRQIAHPLRVVDPVAFLNAMDSRGLLSRH